MPRTFVSQVESGERLALPTMVWAARWKTLVTSCSLSDPQHRLVVGHVGHRRPCSGPRSPRCESGSRAGRRGGGRPPGLRSSAAARPASPQGSPARRSQARSAPRSGRRPSRGHSTRARRSTLPAVRVLAVGNMYPPHHFGGYELLWQSAMEHLRAEGHEVACSPRTSAQPSPDPAIPEGDDVGATCAGTGATTSGRALSPRERLAWSATTAASLEAPPRRPSARVVSWWAMGGMSLSLIERVRRAGLPSVGVVGDVWMVYGAAGGRLERAVAAPRAAARRARRAGSRACPADVEPARDPAGCS